ncbi:DUF6884 domain-containing protein [Streptomyces lavendulae]|uniref:DUF6884 domain-containing protein n=1 Tax=Streptomyces lavendulae TaxID=1914 RepID=UPI0024A00F05|nr:DUF6884 domain-containing protein [Streptomyces lavendulae]GLX22586.1 hypothetical protein Slala01_62300 [Streptomyces lavendulae subsp. lavendulae]GLX30069.1 hypothetical protein Slala02_58890 [Streptomyces lavendulae subsp. lavendulae]
MSRQRFGPPSTKAQGRAWRAAGLLVDVAGRALRTTAQSCASCDGEDLGDTCPGSLPCRSCGAVPHQRCRRPSGHTAEQWHVRRVRAADLEDQRREESGDTTLPARWADARPSDGPTPRSTMTTHPYTSAAGASPSGRTPHGPGRPHAVGSSTPRITPAQRRALLAGAKDPLGLLPKSVNLRTLAALAGAGYVGLDQSRDVLRGREATREQLDVWGGALTEDGWQRARVEGAGRFRIVVVGCGKAKQDRRVIAGAMYVGTFHGSCRETAKALLQDGGRLYILSAAHGLLDLSTEIDPYDITVGDPGSVSADFVQAQVRARGIESAEVTVLAGSKYVALARQSWPALEAPLAGAAGIGEMKQRLSQMRLAARAAAGRER